MPAAIQQRCWHHELRESVCRCPGCGRCFCRECVIEHDGRFLCGSCVGKEARPEQRRGRRLHAVALPIAAILAFVFAWVVLYGAGASIVTLNQRMEQQWRKR